MHTDFRTQVSHARLWGGLLVVAAGAGAMALAVEMSTPQDGTLLRLAEILVMLASVAALIAGAALMFTAFVEVCATCGATIVAATTQLEEAQYQSLIRELAGHDPMHLSALSEASEPAEPASITAAVEYTMCPHCRLSGRLLPCRLRWNERDARLETYEQGEPIVASGWRMARFLRIAGAPGPRG